MSSLGRRERAVAMRKRFALRAGVGLREGSNKSWLSRLLRVLTSKSVRLDDDFGTSHNLRGLPSEILGLPFHH